MIMDFAVLFESTDYNDMLTAEELRKLLRGLANDLVQIYRSF